MKRIIFSLIGCTLLLSACGKEPLPVLPEGEQTISGKVVQAPLSLVRRGTHALQKEGETILYLESIAVPLSQYENRQSTLKGILAYNSDPYDLPVMVVTEVLDSEKGTELLESDFFGLSFEHPLEWKAVVSDDHIQLFAGESQSPLVTVDWDIIENLPEERIQVQIDGQRALRAIETESGAESLYVVRGENVLTIRFTPTEEESLSQRKSEWIALVKSMQLANAGRKDSPIDPVDEGIPCGGPAGILCPEGYFCDVTDLVENIGKCKKFANTGEL